MIIYTDSVEEFIDELHFQAGGILDSVVRVQQSRREVNETVTEVTLSTTALCKSPSGVIFLLSWDGLCGYDINGKSAASEYANSIAMELSKECSQLSLKMRPGKIMFPRQG